MEAKLTINASATRAAAEFMPRAEYILWNWVKALDALGTYLYYAARNKPSRTYHLQVAKIHFAAATRHTPSK
jgi:hypothetical protein